LQGSYDILLLRSLVASRGGLLLRWHLVRSASGCHFIRTKNKSKQFIAAEITAHNN
jgi:hypothetical protein